MGFVVDGDQYYCFITYEGEVHEVEHYRYNNTPYTVKHLIPQGREHPDKLSEWIMACRRAASFKEKPTFCFITTDAIHIPITMNITFWVEKWT